MAAQLISFVANVGISYLLGRLSAQDGPRLQNTSAAVGDYGIPKPRCYGQAVRVTAPFIASTEIEETEHEVQDYSEVVGAISGAAAGFTVAGPVGAVVGAVVGAIFGAVTPDQKYYTYSVPALAILLANRRDDDPIEGCSMMWAAGRRLFDESELAATLQTLDGTDLVVREYGKNKYFGRLRIYGGGAVQGVDDILSAHLDNQPGYRFRAIAVFEDLQLEYFGNAIPSPIEALVHADSNATLASFADMVCARAGIDAQKDLSSSELSTLPLRGYAITGDVNCWDAISPLLPAYQFDAADVAGQVQFYKRDQNWRATIPLRDMGAHEYGTTAPDTLIFKRESDIALPQKTSLTFIDPDRDYQANTASSFRSGGDPRSNINTTLAVTLTADEGKKAAQVMQWDASLGRTAVSFNLTDDWMDIAPGRVYAINVEDVPLPYRITRKARGANGIVEVEALSDENVVYQGAVAGSSGQFTEPESTLIADTVVVAIDMPMTRDDHDDFGFYLAMGANTTSWTRGRIEVSGDGGTTWATALDADESAVMGDVLGTLDTGTTTGLDDTLDTTTVLTVELLHDGMTLSDATDTQLDNWQNFVFVGKDGVGEYLQFKTATKIAARRWELTNLRRGRRGTDHYIDSHVADEQFVLLGNGGIYRIVATDDTGWGDALKLRGVTFRQDVADADIIDFTNNGEAKRPFSPVSLAGSFDGSDNLDLTWTRRSRFFSGDLETDAPETYEIDFVRNGTVVRTETVTTASYQYTNADQVTDGFMAGDSIVVRVHQTNSDYGRSRARVAAFIQPANALELEDDTTPFLMEDGIEPIGLG